MTSAQSDRLARLFTAHGLRSTRQRRALYGALAMTKAHPTAEQLYRSVVGDCHGLSLATVYNTLEAFCRAGLALKLPGPDGSAHYDATVDNHVHLRVERTASVEDLPDDLSQRILDAIPADVLAELQQRTGFKTGHVHVELVGDYES